MLYRTYDHLNEGGAFLLECKSRTSKDLSSTRVLLNERSLAVLDLCSRMKPSLAF